jgi:hypothetical protein
MTHLAIQAVLRLTRAATANGMPSQAEVHLPPLKQIRPHCVTVNVIVERVGQLVEPAIGAR